MTRRRYPHGRTGADDEGEWKALLVLDRAHGRVKLDFGKNLSWVSMTPAQARHFAGQLLRLAGELEQPGVTGSPGTEVAQKEKGA